MEKECTCSKDGIIANDDCPIHYYTFQNEQRFKILFNHNKPFYVRWYRVLSLIITGKCYGY